MAIRVEIDHSLRRVKFTLSGMLQTADMLAAIDQVDAQTAGKQGYDFLSDNRDLVAPASPEQIKALMAYLDHHGFALRGGRGAVVVSSDASYGMIRMMSVYAERLGVHVDAFRSLDEAIQFLAAGGAK